MIDLHLHTTASDGRCTPLALVDRAADAGVLVMAVTDHDTIAAVPEVQAAALAREIEAIAGIEITAVQDDTDVHVLGYFMDCANPVLTDFLEQQRESRFARVEEIGRRLSRLGMAVDTAALVKEGRQTTGRAIGRPQVARALVSAGFVRDTREAFDKWLGRGCPAFVPRLGASPSDVVAIIHEAGGLASLAHPGRTAIDGLIAPLCEGGLDALEVFHSDHDDATTLRYLAIAREYDLLVTGGSDFHGEPGRKIEPGTAHLPMPEWDRLHAARARHATGS